MSDPPAWSDAFVGDALRQFVPRLPLAQITPEWAWGGSTGRGVRVAVIDSGVDAGHPAIGGRVAGSVIVRETSAGIELEEGPHRDTFGHGTACAGIILAAAPECEIFSVRVLGSRLSGRGAVFGAGLRWAIERRMQICNLSLGTTKLDYYGMFHQLADLAYFQNVMLVAAANNQPVPSFPSMFASVISVASHDVADPNIFYFNPAPPVEVGAPGIDVDVAWLDGQRMVATGNSFSAPHISGIVARILGKHPGLTVFQVKTILAALAANGPRPAP